MSTSSRRSRPPAVPQSPRQHAVAIAEAVDSAWHSHHGGSDIHLPISVVAALSLVTKGPGDGDPTQRALLLDTAGFTQLLRDLWLRFSLARPDLNPRTQPLWRWLLDEDPDESTLRAAHAAGRAALSRGILELTGVEDRRWEVDLLASLVQTMRARSARTGLGQFMTPLDVTVLLGRMVAPEPGATICEPCAGTGTMLLGAATAMRQHGHDPASCTWYANDLDWLAAACLAVNTHLWGLGTRVLIGCGDGLGEWTEQALAQRRQAIDEMESVWRTARFLAGARALLFDPIWNPEARASQDQPGGDGSQPLPADSGPMVENPTLTEPGLADGPASVPRPEATEDAGSGSELARRLGLAPVVPQPRSSQQSLF